MKMQLIIKGTPKEVQQQLDSLVAYYGEKETLKVIIENENRIGKKIEEEPKEKNSKPDTSNLDPIFADIVKGMFGI